MPNSTLNIDSSYRVAPVSGDTAFESYFSPSSFSELIESEIDSISFTSHSIKTRIKPLGAIRSVWRNNFDKALFHNIGLNQNLLTIYRPNGNELRFERSDNSNGRFLPQRVDNQSADYVVQTGQGYIYISSTSLIIEHYDVSGKFIRQIFNTGYEQNLIYDDNDFLIEVNDSEGKK